MEHGVVLGSSLLVICLSSTGQKAAMASAVPDKEKDSKSSLEMKEEEQQQQGAACQVANLTLVSSACDMVSTAYASTKESHPYIRTMCDAAEKGMKSVTEATASCVLSVLTILEPHVAASKYASQGLDKLGERLALLQKPVEQLLCDTKEQISSGVADAKDDVSSKVTEVIDANKETLQSGMEADRSAVTSSVGMVVASSVDQAAVKGIEDVLGITEDKCLPIGNGELASEEGADIMPVEQQQEKRSYFVQLESLSEFRLFAYMHSTNKMKQVWQGMWEVLAQLHFIFDLIQVFKQGFNQKLQEVQKKLHQMWLDWSRKSCKESGDESSIEPEEMESLALLLACSITQQLQIMCCKIASSIKGLKPLSSDIKSSNLQDKVKESLGTVEELHASFLAANSLQDLSSSVLTQNQGKLAVIQKYMKELLDYLKNIIPLSWLVGPFHPREEKKTSQEEVETLGAGHHEASTTLM